MLGYLLEYFDNCSERYSAKERLSCNISSVIWSLRNFQVKFDEILELIRLINRMIVLLESKLDKEGMGLGRIPHNIGAIRHQCFKTYFYGIYKIFLEAPEAKRTIKWHKLAMEFGCNLVDKGIVEDLPEALEYGAVGVMKISDTFEEFEDGLKYLENSLVRLNKNRIDLSHTVQVGISTIVWFSKKSEDLKIKNFKLGIDLWCGLLERKVGILKVLENSYSYLISRISNTEELASALKNFDNLVTQF